jgi:hypothetical protein
VLVGLSEANCRRVVVWVSGGFGDIETDIHGCMICDSRFQTCMLRSVPCGEVMSVGVYSPGHCRNEWFYPA